MFAFNVPFPIKTEVATNGHLKHDQNNQSSKKLTALWSSNNNQSYTLHIIWINEINLMYLSEQRGKQTERLPYSAWNSGCLPLCQRFPKFRSEFKRKGPFRFLPTGIFGITSGRGPLISVGIFRSKFAVPFLTNRFFALIREFGNDKKWQELFLSVGAV